MKIFIWTLFQNVTVIDKMISILSNRFVPKNIKLALGQEITMRRNPGNKHRNNTRVRA